MITRRKFLRMVGVAIGMATITSTALLATAPQKGTNPLFAGEMGQFDGVRFVQEYPAFAERDELTAKLWANHLWAETKKESFFFKVVSPGICEEIKIR